MGRSVHLNRNSRIKSVKLRRASTIGGCLVDLDPYPGLILFVKGVVHGELYDIADQSVMSKLDEFELYNDADLHPYLRSKKAELLYIMVAATTNCGETAYVYAHNGEIDDDGKFRSGELVPGGDWIEYKEIRDKRTR
jgi:gamma-glutamylcyclotransferase (GGCT)/AIG2-like uncharacterized protein YtfP